jgi:hypothetical protein
MDIANIARDVEHLTAADAVIAESYLLHVLRQASLYAIAGIIGITAAMLFELAAFWMIEPPLGAIAAFVILGIANGVLSVALLVLAMQLRPVRDLSMALQMPHAAM